MQLPYVSVAEPGKRYTSLFCTQSLPLSRGTVHIASADPLAPPAIDPKYYSNDADLDLTTRAIEVALKLFKTDPLARHVKKLVVPSADVVAQGRDGLREYLRQNCGTVYHPVGTAAMMPRADGGVVDPTLKVYGTSNLRVVSVVNLVGFGCSVAHERPSTRSICLSCPWLVPHIPIAD